MTGFAMAPPKGETPVAAGGSLASGCVGWLVAIAKPALRQTEGDSSKRLQQAGVDAADGPHAARRALERPCSRGCSLKDCQAAGCCLQLDVLRDLKNLRRQPPSMRSSRMPAGSLALPTSPLQNGSLCSRVVMCCSDGSGRQKGGVAGNMTGRRRQPAVV